MAPFKPEWDFFKLWKHLFGLCWVLKLRVDFLIRIVFKPGVDFLKLQRRVKLRGYPLKLQIALFKLHWVLREWVGMPKMTM